jgi:glycosyltransferase involved in cell wall biosynthesis
MQGDLAVSMIICTRDRCQQLARCLQSVGSISFDLPWELIIVDNGSVDDTAAVVQEFKQSVSVPVSYIQEIRPGLGNGHNAGLRRARGDVVAFTDDDCYPARDFLSQLWAAFGDPSVGYICGRVLLHDPGDSPIGIIESKVSRIFPPRYFHHPSDIMGANMAFRRRVLTDIGGFDPTFGPGAMFNAEDQDAAARASAKGWKGAYHPEVVVRHHHGRKASDIARLFRSYDIGRGALHMKLLLRQREFLWFARGVYRLRNRMKWSRSAPLWETVGAVKYTSICLKETVRDWFSRTK